MVKKLSATLTFLISLLFPLWLLRKQCAKKVVSDSPAGLKIMAENVQPDCGLDRSNSGLASHFNQSFLNTNILFSIQLSFCCHLTHSLLDILLKNAF